MLFMLQVRLQTMPNPAPGEAPMYTGTLDCAKKTVKRENIVKTVTIICENIVNNLV